MPQNPLRKIKAATYITAPYFPNKGPQQHEVGCNSIALEFP